MEIHLWRQHRDLDDDGDKDIILSSGTAGVGNDIVWFLNDGTGSYGSEVVIDDTQSQAYVYTLNDFDNDGDLDIASNSFNEDALNYFENLKYTLSLPENEVVAVSIYPNPTSNQLYFKGINQNFDLTINNILGKNVLTVSQNINEALDISSLANGVYFLKIEDLNQTFKIIKQ